MGDLYNAAFKVLRVNAKATIGSALIVCAVTSLIPVLAAGLGLLAIGESEVFSSDLSGEPSSDSDLVFFVTLVVSLVGLVVLQWAGMQLVSGMIAHVTLQAAIGRRVSLGEAWRMTRGQRWRVIGLSATFVAIFLVCLALYVALWFLVVTSDSVPFMIGWGVLTVPALVALTIWAGIRFTYLAVPPLMVERLSIWGAIARTGHLTRHQFWRTFGIALLTGILAAVAANLLSAPFQLGSLVVPLMMPSTAGFVISLVVQLIGSMLATAIVTPFQSAVVALQYLDQRMRKEGYDVELMAQAGITTP